MKTRLSVNVNKVALLRNSRGENLPDVLEVARDCEKFGAQGITVHPRPDERHITYQDVRELKEVVINEFNIEGNPTEEYMKLVKEVKPHQATLVPDPPDALTSDTGWDTIKYGHFLRETANELHKYGIRVSIFLDPDLQMVEAAAKTGIDRIELYTGPYAANYPEGPEKALKPYQEAAEKAEKLGLGVNAGHDLNLKNLKYLDFNIPSIKEVSIGHALICDALYYGLENTIQLYQRQLQHT